MRDALKGKKPNAKLLQRCVLKKPSCQIKILVSARSLAQQLLLLVCMMTIHESRLAMQRYYEGRVGTEVRASTQSGREKVLLVSVG